VPSMSITAARVLIWSSSPTLRWSWYWAPTVRAIRSDRVVRLGERGIVRVDPVGGARFDGQRLPRIDTARTGSARIRVGGPGLLRHPEEAVLVARLDPEEIAP
jgi:hypothetical protein